MYFVSYIEGSQPIIEEIKLSIFGGNSPKKLLELRNGEERVRAYLYINATSKRPL
jgi:hypothetical protein